MGKCGRLDWRYRADYIRHRSRRHPGDTDIEPEWADEAFADPAAMNEHPDHASKSGRTDRVLGYSPTVRMVIAVIWMPETMIGVNAWKANDTEARQYWERGQR
ncbi:MAG: hypothetical protein ACRDN9_07950 [Streptosporangiaceae bacterium]